MTAVAGLAQTASPTPLSAAAQAERDATREKLRTLLAARSNKAIGVTFTQSTKNPYNFVGSLNTGLKNAQSYEIVISVTTNNTIGFRVYPHYNNGYVNLDKARNGPALSRQLLYFCDRNFLFWGADSTSDVFAGYTITLESGFPDEVVVIVLRSVPLLDSFLGDMRPNIDGTQKL